MVNIATLKTRLAELKWAKANAERALANINKRGLALQQKIEDLKKEKMSGTQKEKAPIPVAPQVQRNVTNPESPDQVLTGDF